MKKLLSKLCWCTHRALCWMRIHSVEPVWKFNEKSGEFELDGSFCTVCTKSWEDK